MAVRAIANRRSERLAVGNCDRSAANLVQKRRVAFLWPYSGPRAQRSNLAAAEGAASMLSKKIRIVIGAAIRSALGRDDFTAGI